MKTRDEKIEAIVSDLRAFMERDVDGFWDHVEDLEREYLKSRNDADLDEIFQITTEEQEEDDKFIVDVKYPHIHVQLTGKNENAFVILGLMEQALKKEKVPPEEIQEFRKEAISSDYNYLLQTCMKWVSVS